MGTMASQIISLILVYSTVYSVADQRKQQSSVSLDFSEGTPRWPMDSPFTRSIMLKLFSFNDVTIRPLKLRIQTHLIYLVEITVTSHESHGISNHQELNRLFNSFSRLVKKKHQCSALLALCEWNLSATGGFHTWKASDVESVSVSWHQYHIWLCPMYNHYSNFIMSMMASQIISLTIVYPIVYSGAVQGTHQSSSSLAFVRGIHRWPVNSPHKGP